MNSRHVNGRANLIWIRVPVLAASLALNLLALLMPLAILLIFDRVIPFQSTETLKLVVLALAVVAGLEYAARGARSVLLGFAASDVAIENQRRYLNSVLSANSVAFAADASAVHLERHAALARLRDFHAAQNQALAIDLPFSGIFIVMVALIGGWLVLVPLAGLGAVLLFARIMKRTQWTLFDKRKDLDARRYAFLAEVLSSMPTVKANTMERQLTRRFEMLQDQTVDTSGGLIRFSGLAQSYGAVFAQVSVVLMGLFGSYLVIRGFIGIAELAACMLLNGRILQPLMKLLSHRVQTESMAVARSKLDDALAIAADPASRSLPAGLVGRVELQRASMAGSDGNRSAFDQVSAIIPQGTTALVEAEDPWAVRAFFDGLTGQRRPTAGQILVDGRLAIERVGQHGSDGIVALETAPAIFNGTLLENLAAFGDPEQVERAKYFAERLGLAARIHRLPMGYNTQLAQGSTFERNATNRQLIALTRVLAIRPRILLMNEPTAVLDTPERQALSDCLKSLDPQPTILIASPDPRMQRLASTKVNLSSPAVAEWDRDAAADKAEALFLERGAA